ncbi:MAG TPA: ABC transporter ATP-binding protein, partial [Burkholderiaceae bacterium]|nr:ABC transporter ATP-binding protein [Burkholderiaceae bacterium]
LQHGGVGALAQAGLWVLAIVLVSIGAWTLHGPGRVLERNVGVRVRQRVAQALHERLADAPLTWHEQHHSGQLQQRVSQSSHALQNFAQSQFIYLQSAVNFFGPLVALWLLAPSIAAVACAGYLVVGCVIVRFDVALMKLSVRENQAERHYASGLLDVLANIGSVMCLRLQPATQRLLAGRLGAVFAPLKRAIVLNEVKWCAVDILGVCLTWGLVATFVWRTGAAHGTVMIGALFMVYQYAQQAGGVIGSMAQNFQGLARTRTDYASAQPIWQAPQRGAAVGAVRGDWQTIEIHGLHHRPAADEDAPRIDDPGARGRLDDVALRLQRGERIAVVGPSGAGKSTLMRVLAGLYEPQAARIAVDGIEQPDARHLGAIATLIPQEPEVFECSVRENIVFGAASEPGALERAIRVSALDEVLVTLPEGLDTFISEGGANLSGGQRQRLCLARGVLAARGSSLVLLDEPTSALDPMTESSVLQRLRDHFADACIVAAVHRMSLLKHFDSVVLLVDGRVVDSGPASELAARQLLFARMLASQAVDVTALPVAER